MSIDKSKVIKVIGPESMCFQVDAQTLEAICCEYYDPWARTHPEAGYKETISHSEWLRRLDEKHEKEKQEFYLSFNKD